VSVKVKFEVTLLHKKNAKNVILLTEYDKIHFYFTWQYILYVSYFLITL